MFNRKKHDTKLMQTLDLLAATDAQVVEVLQTLRLGFAGLAERVGALEQALQMAQRDDAPSPPGHARMN